MNDLDEPTTSWDDNIVYYVTHLVNQFISSATIRSHLSGIKYMLKLGGIDLKETSFLVHVLLQAGDRARAEEGIEFIRIPITETVLLKLLVITPVVIRNSFEVKLLRMVMTVAFYGLLRISEITGPVHQILIDNINWNPRTGSLKLQICTAKNLKKAELPWQVKITTQDSERVNIRKIFEDYIGARPESQLTRQFIVHQSGRATTPHYIRTRITSIINHIGLEGQDYGVHSFRVGRAT